MRDLIEININDGGKPVSRPAPDQELRAVFEQKYHIRIPDDLWTLLLFSNGGHPELNSIQGDFERFGINRIFHLSLDREHSESLWYAMKHWAPTIGTSTLPFAANGGGDQFFLDLNRNPAPVGIWLHEGEEIEWLAPSFAAFIDALELNPDLI